MGSETAQHLPHILHSNADCSWGNQYPADMYLTTGSGINRLIVVPSLDLVATITGRLRWSMKEVVTQTYLSKLFGAITDQYVTCTGQIVNDAAGGAPGP